MADAGIVEQQVHAGAALEGRHGERLDRLGVRDVDDVRRRSPAGRGDLAGHGRRPLGVHVGDVHDRAAPAELDSDGTSYARPGTGDDGDATDDVEARAGGHAQSAASCASASSRPAIASRIRFCSPTANTSVHSRGSW